MTVCNMSIEAGARAGMIAPDDTTFAYLAGRPHAPQGAAWDAAVARWRELPTDDGARFDRAVTIDAGALEPMITFGTNPGMGIPMRGIGARPDDVPERAARDAREGAPLHGPRAGQAAARPQGRRRVHRQLHQLAARRPARRGRGDARPQGRAAACACWSCPARSEVKRQAEAEGLDDVFRDAGAEWREAGCSMCIAMNGDQLEPGQYAVSHQQPQLRGPPGPGRPHLPRQPAHRGGAAVTRRHQPTSGSCCEA